LLGRQFEGGISETAIRWEGILSRTIDPMVNLGLGILFFTIALLLLVIIRWLVEQRRGSGNLTAEFSGGAVSPPAAEAQLWPARLVTPFAIFGIFVIGAVRFIGIASLSMAIGLALVAIVVNLRATALALPQAFSNLIGVARGRSSDDDDDDGSGQYDLMELAPWNLFRPLLVGVVIVVTGTLPAVIFCLEPRPDAWGAIRRRGCSRCNLETLRVQFPGQQPLRSLAYALDAIRHGDNPLLRRPLLLQDRWVR